MTAAERRKQFQDISNKLPSIQAFDKDAKSTGPNPAPIPHRRRKAGKSFPVTQRLWASFADVVTALAALEQAPGSLMKSKVEQKAVLMRSVWQGILPVMAYSCTSIYMVISVAYVLRHKKSKNANYTTLLLMYQNLCGLLLWFPASHLGWQTFEFFNMRAAWQMLPNSALFAIMVYSSTQAIRALPVPMTSVLRNLAPITITLVEWLLMKGPVPSLGVLFSMALLLLGAFVAAVNDLAFNPVGYLWMMTNVASNVSHLLVLRKLKLNKDLSNTQILHYSALWSLFWLIPVGLYEDIGHTVRELTKMPLEFKLVVMSTGINHILAFLATIWCLERTSGSTYSIIGALNKIPIAIVGFIFFKTPTSHWGVAGICIGLLGGLVFTIAKLQEMQRAIEASHERKQQLKERAQHHRR